MLGREVAVHKCSERILSALGGGGHVAAGIFERVLRRLGDQRV